MAARQLDVREWRRHLNEFSAQRRGTNCQRGSICLQGRWWESSDAKPIQVVRACAALRLQHLFVGGGNTCCIGA